MKKVLITFALVAAGLGTATGLVYPSKGRSESTSHAASTAAALESGNPVNSDDLSGRPAVVALLWLHCYHSIELLPILTELAERFRAERMRVVGIFVNSRDTGEVKCWVPELYPDYDGQYEVWVADDTSIGDTVNSHLTPTYLIVDAQGQVRKKLVGFKARTMCATSW